MSKLVVYTDGEGYKWVHEVPADLVDELTIKYGIRLGPPTLSLGLSSEEECSLNNALCEAFIFDYDSMNRRRGEVLGIIQKTLVGVNPRAILTLVVSAYQLASYSRDNALEE